jgi:hypothetical protein
MKVNYPGGFNDQNTSVDCQSAFGARDGVCCDKNPVKTVVAFHL